EGALAPIRLAEPFERLRDLSDACLQRTGAQPKVYLAALGPESRRRRRVGFAREWLVAGGFEPVCDGETATAEEAVERLRTSGAPLVCLCGTDEAYRGQAEAFARALKAAGAKGVALVGSPGELERAWRAAGADVVATMERLYRCIGCR